MSGSGLGLLDGLEGNLAQLSELATEEKKPDTVYRKEIDLGDGSGVQVFEASSYEELVEKLAEAQRNATAKIRELNQRLKQRQIEPEKRPEREKPTPRKLSEAEAQEIADQILRDPYQAFNRLFESVTGASATEFTKTIERVNEIVDSLAAREAAEQFVIDHEDDYLPSVKNFKAIQSLLNEEGLPITRNNLEYAFNKLSEAGQLEKPKVQAEVAQSAKVSEPLRIEGRSRRPEDRPPTTISSASSVRNEPEDVWAIAEEIEKLPLEQARDRIVKELLRAAGQSR